MKSNLDLKKFFYQIQKLVEKYMKKMHLNN